MVAEGLTTASTVTSFTRYPTRESGQDQRPIVQQTGAFWAMFVSKVGVDSG